MKNFRPLAFFVVFVLLFSLACSALSGGGDTPSQPSRSHPYRLFRPKNRFRSRPKSPHPNRPIRLPNSGRTAARARVRGGISLLH